MRRVLTLAEVMARIEPVDPDLLRAVEPGVYEAWWSPLASTELDLFVLGRVPGVEVVAGPEPLPHLPAWVRVRFVIETADVL